MQESPLVTILIKYNKLLTMQIQCYVENHCTQNMYFYLLPMKFQLHKHEMENPWACVFEIEK